MAMSKLPGDFPTVWFPLSGYEVEWEREKLKEDLL